MSAQSRILIIVNKYWECDPVCWVLTNKYFFNMCGTRLSRPKFLTYPSWGPVKSIPCVPRMVYSIGDIHIEIWCISDLLSRFPDHPNFQSSSQRKMDVLGEPFQYDTLPVSLVVSVGTASSGPCCPILDGYAQDNINGSVIVGSKVFIHDGHPSSDPNPYSQWRCSFFDQLMNSSIEENRFVESIQADAFKNLLLCPPLNPPANGQNIYVDTSYIAVGDINVTNYAEYKEKDKAAGDAFVTNCPTNSNGVSLETTHGLIYTTAGDYFQTDPPFLFVSSVVDRYTMFDIDVSKKRYPQNTTAAHNAGVVIALLFSSFAAL